MTLPVRGIWKNSVLVNVLHEHQIKSKVSNNKHVFLPVGQQTPPSGTHHNTHVAAPLPGLKKLKPREKTYSPQADKQIDVTRNQKRFIAGTASATTRR